MSSVFFLNDTATTEIYTLSLHDALPISLRDLDQVAYLRFASVYRQFHSVDDFEAEIALLRVEQDPTGIDRKSTRLNSSHANISYAVFCLKKKKMKLQNYLVKGTDDSHVR